MNPNSPFSKSRSLSDGKRFRSALKGLEELLIKSSKPGIALICNYNMGAIHWSSLGNGSRAREHYQAAVRIARSGQLPSEDETVKTILANSCENLMLLSLSYEEYEDWSRQLRELQPKNDIFRGQAPVLLNAREQGHPWSDMLQEIAHSYYNRGNSASDPGRSGCGAATWELLLTNRKTLRVSREDWQDAVYEFGALAMRIVSDAMMMMEKSPEGRDLNECLFVVDPAIRFAEEFLAVNPDDQRIGKLLESLGEFCRSARAEFGQRTPTVRGASHPAEPNSGRQPGSNPIRFWLHKLLGKVGSKPLTPASQQDIGGANKLLTASAQCSRCGAAMTVFLGVGQIGRFPRAVFVHQSHRGCFCCGACGRYYCWDCSDSRKPCTCGAAAWRERQYFPAGVSPEQALKGLV